MRFSTALSLVIAFLIALANAGEVPPNNHRHYTYIAIKVDDKADPIDVAHSLGYKLVGPIGELQGYFLVAQTHDVVRRNALSLRRSGVLGTESGTDAKIASKQIEADANVLWAEVQVPKRRRIVARQALSDANSVETSGIKSARQKYQIQDPEFGYQWHILNEGAGQVGHDHNITAAWAQGVFGKGSTVCIVDDGLYHKGNDLAGNYFAEGSYDFIDYKAEVAPGSHGTSCGGEIAAVKNNVCGVGVAYEAKLSAVRILSNTTGNSTDDVGDSSVPADEAAGLNYKFQQNHIYSCSWGPDDDGKSMDPLPVLTQEAFKNGVANGRGGLGSVFVFASGNGGNNDDDCGFDAYQTSIYTISVGALDRFDNHPKYGEKCSAKLITMYSGGDDPEIQGIATTEWSLTGSGDQCTRSMDGTSAATPLAAGIFALVNSVRPDLTWRDYQHLCVNSAVVVNPTHPSWFKTAAGRSYSTSFGYGKLDAGRIIDLARTWKSVGNRMTVFDSGVKTPVNGRIPQEPGTDVRVSFSVTDADKEKAGLLLLEHVTVTVWVEHQRRGDVFFELISPNGVVSNLASGRSLDVDTTGFQGWQFMTVAHWDEDVVGEWIVVISDRDHPEAQGVVKGVSMQFYGSVKDGVAVGATANPLNGTSGETNSSNGTKSGSSNTGLYVGVGVGVVVGLALFAAGWYFWFRKTKSVSKEKLNSNANFMTSA
ncbi:subtilisin-like protein [Rhizoclosmatium globosum]|uniref:Subtilisin-like protein n=1 Tax=Rhizoclosmatium globosum TaxID=329046 RepID=A0A1Y2BCI6_9FUNG|nr:subtilisin-like protein [Rhizoclosmatium globosum]|eukprot:ORY32474.1 subtilisin-like protein [Rhizoclosmatium globosum]